MAASSPAGAASGLVATDFTPFVLQSREAHTHNTDLFVFRLPGGADAELALPVSSCLMARCTGADGNPVLRPYTPVNQHERGVLQLLVKRYAGGAMSSHIHSLKEGDTLDLKGPFAKLKYEANKWKHIGMLAGGTGITPMVQVLDEIFRNPSDQTRVTLLCFNTSAADVLLRPKLEAYVAAHGDGDRFRCVFVTDKKEQGADWVAETGYASLEMLKQYMPAPAADTLIYTCGPPAFMNVVSGDKMPDKTQGPLIGLLKEMGYDSSMVCKQ